jgi:sulfite reductase (ferredoxin)
LEKSNVIAQNKRVLRRNKSPFRRFYTDKARVLADLIKNYGANELRFSLKQNIVVRNIRENLALSRISQIRLVTLGYDTINDITVQELIL